MTITKSKSFQCPRGRVIARGTTFRTIAKRTIPCQGNSNYGLNGIPTSEKTGIVAPQCDNKSFLGDTRRIDCVRPAPVANGYSRASCDTTPVASTAAASHNQISVRMTTSSLGPYDIPIFQAGVGKQADALRACPGYRSFYEACRQVWIGSNDNRRLKSEGIWQRVQAKMESRSAPWRFIKQIPRESSRSSSSSSSKRNTKVYIGAVITETKKIEQICMSRINNMRQRELSKSVGRTAVSLAGTVRDKTNDLNLAMGPSCNHATSTTPFELSNKENMVTPTPGMDQEPLRRVRVKGKGNTGGTSKGYKGCLKSTRQPPVPPAMENHPLGSNWSNEKIKERCELKNGESSIQTKDRSRSMTISQRHPLIIVQNRGTALLQQGIFDFKDDASDAPEQRHLVSRSGHYHGCRIDANNSLVSPNFIFPEQTRNNENELTSTMNRSAWNTVEPLTEPFSMLQNYLNLSIQHEIRILVQDPENISGVQNDEGSDAPMALKHDLMSSNPRFARSGL